MEGACSCWYSHRNNAKANIDAVCTVVVSPNNSLTAVVAGASAKPAQRRYTWCFFDRFYVRNWKHTARFSDRTPCNTELNEMEVWRPGDDDIIYEFMQEDLVLLHQRAGTV